MAFAALDAMRQVKKIELSFSDLRDLTGVDVETTQGASALAAWARDNGRKLSVSNILKMVSLSAEA